MVFSHNLMQINSLCSNCVHNPLLDGVDMYQELGITPTSELDISHMSKQVTPKEMNVELSNGSCHKKIHLPIT